MRYKRSYFFVLPFLALGFLVMGRSAEGDVVEEVSTKQEGAVVVEEVKQEVENMEVEEVEQEVVKVEDMEVVKVEQKMLASESLGDLRLELGRKLHLQGGLEVELGHILVRVRENKNFKDSKIFHAKTLRIELVKFIKKKCLKQEFQ